ncbi:MAG: transcriptional regulator [Pirellulaceae bacterium]
MNAASRHQLPTNEELPRDMLELEALIRELPTEFRGKLEVAYARVAESTSRRRRILNLVQEALSQLRLDMKYLVFDLEATRRERDAYRSAAEGDEE